MIGRLGKRGRKRTNTSPLGWDALGRATVSLAQREQSEVAEKRAAARMQKLLLDLSTYLEALSDPDEWGLRTGGRRGPAREAEGPMTWGGRAAGR